MSSKKFVGRVKLTILQANKPSRCQIRLYRNEIYQIRRFTEGGCHLIGINNFFRNIFRDLNQCGYKSLIAYL